jgi:hypothetical protein
LIYTGGATGFVDTPRDYSVPGYYTVVAEVDGQTVASNIARGAAISGRELCVATTAVDTRFITILDAAQSVAAPPLGFVGVRTTLELPTVVKVNPASSDLIVDLRVFGQQATGNVLPDRVLPGAPILGIPGGVDVAVGPNDNLFVSGSTGIFVHTLDSTIDAPVVARQLTAQPTIAVAYDQQRDQILALVGSTVQAYASSNDVTRDPDQPARMVVAQVLPTGLSFSYVEMNVDSTNDELWVLWPSVPERYSAGVTVWALNDGTLKRTLYFGPNAPLGVGVDVKNDEVWIASSMGAQAFPRAISGWTDTPLRRIPGPSGGYAGVAVDPDAGEVYLSNRITHGIDVYDRLANGGSPRRTIGSPDTWVPLAVAADPQRGVMVAEVNMNVLNPLPNMHGEAPGLLVYGQGADGDDKTPLAITAPAFGPVAIDSANNEIVLAAYLDPVSGATVYDVATGALKRAIAGLAGNWSIAAFEGGIYASSGAQIDIYDGFAATATVKRTIAWDAAYGTGLSVAIDPTNREIFVIAEHRDYVLCPPRQWTNRCAAHHAKPVVAPWGIGHCPLPLRLG